MSDEKIEALEKRILALESLAQSQSQNENLRTMVAMSSIPGFLRGQSALQNFFEEAIRQSTLVVPVDPLPVPGGPVESPCQMNCWNAYKINLNHARTTDERLKVVDDYRACMSACDN